jgi:hypothetical protein
MAIHQQLSRLDTYVSSLKNVLIDVAKKSFCTRRTKGAFLELIVLSVLCQQHSFRNDSSQLLDDPYGYCLG